MAKKTLEIKGVCAIANKNKQGSNIVIAVNPERQPDGKQTARTAASFIIPDATAADKFDTQGKTYTVTVTED